MRIEMSRCLTTCLVAQIVKNPPAMEETLVQSLGWEDALEKGMAAHSGILAWGIPWTRSWWATIHGVAESDTTERLILIRWASLVAQSVKNLPAVQETWIQSLDHEYPLEKERRK